MFVPIKVPELNGYQKTWNTICQAEAFVAHSRFFPERRNDYGPWFRQWLDLGREVTGAQYAMAVHERNECIGKISRIFQDIDVLILPGLGSAPFQISDETQYGAIPDTWFEGDYSATVGVFNFSGSPSLTLPCGFSKAGLPLGMPIGGAVKSRRSDLSSWSCFPRSYDISFETSESGLTPTLPSGSVNMRASDYFSRPRGNGRFTCEWVGVS